MSWPNVGSFFWDPSYDAHLAMCAARNPTLFRTYEESVLEAESRELFAKHLFTMQIWQVDIILTYPSLCAQYLVDNARMLLGRSEQELQMILPRDNVITDANARFFHEGLKNWHESAMYRESLHNHLCVALGILVGCFVHG